VIYEIFTASFLLKSALLPIIALKKSSRLPKFNPAARQVSMLRGRRCDRLQSYYRGRVEEMGDNDASIYAAGGSPIRGGHALIACFRVGV
jgi:hypothetical protein